MGLRRLCLTAGLAVLTAMCFAPGALAWTFSTTGSVTCDRATGQHVVTWSIDNRTEPEGLTIRESSRASVAVGSTVAARSIGQFAERLAGSTTGTVTLTVKGNWPSDRLLRLRTASVTLSSACLADVCPNLDGVQEQVPSGLIKDTAGACVPPPPTDVCSNIEGVQTKVPEGFVLEGGKCVCPPHEVEKVIVNTVEKRVEVPGPERLVAVASAPQVIERVVTKIVIKKVKVKAKKKAKRKRKALRPRVLPFTP